MTMARGKKWTRARVHDAFKELEKLGYFAPRKAWTCCQTCGVYEIEHKGPFVFYHSQDLDGFNKDGKLWLAWGDKSKEPDEYTAITIVAAMQRQGLIVYWSGNLINRIVVHT